MRRCRKARLSRQHLRRRKTVGEAGPSRPGRPFCLRGHGPRIPDPGTARRWGGLGKAPCGGRRPDPPAAPVPAEAPGTNGRAPASAAGAPPERPPAAPEPAPRPWAPAALPPARPGPGRSLTSVRVLRQVLLQQRQVCAEGDKKGREPAARLPPPRAPACRPPPAAGPVPAILRRPLLRRRPGTRGSRGGARGGRWTRAGGGAAGTRRAGRGRRAGGGSGRRADPARPARLRAAPPPASLAPPAGALSAQPGPVVRGVWWRGCCRRRSPAPCGGRGGRGLPRALLGHRCRPTGRAHRGPRDHLWAGSTASAPAAGRREQSRGDGGASPLVPRVPAPGSGPLRRPRGGRATRV